ncbi:NAD-dependent epimerase/dehydratase family protein [Moraxella oblonga]|uniref:NAD-dependent epimerase/dehydratase family protein n=1 Tax=Moraxella oblonga TaxID=200413 RepID=UPI00082E4AF5|nr:NAD-dependent epimerase/dehydratase family protein [Moraxella oblonga]
MQKILIIGQGTIGKPIAQCLANQGHHITAVARSPKSYDTDDITFWQKDATMLTAKELADFEQIVIIVAPNQPRPDQRTFAYQQTYLTICQHMASFALPNLKRIIFISSTSVYGENDGESIDITTPANPNTDTAHILLNAERTLQDKFSDKCVIVRPSGIYGLSKRMLNVAKNAHIDGTPSHHYTNRIHANDLIDILCQIIKLDHAEPLYVATDNHPTTSLEVLNFICQTMHYPPPKIIPSPPTGKKIMGNVGQWLNYHDYQMEYGEILGK